MAQEKKKAKVLTDGEEPHSIKIEVKTRGIEVLIHTLDGCDALELSGAVVRHLRIMETEPRSLILP